MFEGIPRELAFRIEYIVGQELDLPDDPDDVMAIRAAARSLLGRVQGEVEIPKTYSVSARRNLVIAAVQSTIRVRAKKNEPAGGVVDLSPARIAAVFGLEITKLTNLSIVDEVRKNSEAAAILDALRRRPGVASDFQAMHWVRNAILMYKASSVRAKLEKERGFLKSKQVTQSVFGQLLSVRTFDPKNKNHRLLLAKRMFVENWGQRLLRFFRSLTIQVSVRKRPFADILLAHGWKANDHRSAFISLFQSAGCSYESVLEEGSEERARKKKGNIEAARTQANEMSRKRTAELKAAVQKPAVVAKALSHFFGLRKPIPPGHPKWRSIFKERGHEFDVSALERKKVEIGKLPPCAWLLVLQAWSEEHTAGWGIYRIKTEVCGIPPAAIPPTRWKAAHYKDQGILREALRLAFDLPPNIGWDIKHTKKLHKLFSGVTREIAQKVIRPSPMLTETTLVRMSLTLGEGSTPGVRRNLNDMQLHTGGYEKLLEVVGLGQQYPEIHVVSSHERAIIKNNLLTH